MYAGQMNDMSLHTDHMLGLLQQPNHRLHAPVQPMLHLEALQPAAHDPNMQLQVFLCSH